MKCKIATSFVCFSLLYSTATLGANAVRVPQGNVTVENGYLDLSTGKGIIFPDGVQTSATGGSGVTSVTGADPLSNTGTATNPVISLTGTIPDAKLSGNVNLLNTDQTVSGKKTFSAPIASTVTTGTAPLTVNSTTQITNLNAEMVGGKKLTELDTRYLLPTQAVASTATYAVGSMPRGIAYCANNTIWVANNNSNKVTALNASTGALIGTYTVPYNPYAVNCSDGGYLWVTSTDQNPTITKMSSASDGTIWGTYPTGNSPQALTFDGTFMWVANTNDSTVSKINTSTGATIGTPTSLGSGANPVSLLFDGTYIWAGNTNATVSKLDPATGTLLTTYNVAGRMAAALVFDGSFLWIANGSSINDILNNDLGSSVSKMNPANGAIIGTYTVGLSPSALVFDGQYIYASNANSNSVTILEPTTGAVKGTIPVGSYPVGMITAGRNIWTTNATSNNVTKVSSTVMYAMVPSASVTTAQLANGSVTGAQLANGSVTSANISGVLSVAVGGTGTSTGSIAGTGTLTFTAGGTDSNINVVPTGNGTVDVASKRITSLANPVASTDAVSKGYLYSVLGNSSRPDMTPLNIATLAWYNYPSYPTGTLPYGVAFDGTNIWVANYGSNSVTKLLASSGATVGTYTVGSAPYGVAFDGTNIWVVNYSSNSVTKLLASSGATVGTYTVGSSPTGVAFDGTNIWVSNYGSKSLTKLLASSGATVGTYTVGSSPTRVAFDGTNIWVSNYGSNSVTKLPAR